jgi:hypothetical protein
MLKALLIEVSQAVNPVLCVWLAVVGVSAGTIAYHVNNPQPEPYKASMTRATTYTGKGQFKCQTGC